jgi:hypothetical protein
VGLLHAIVNVVLNVSFSRDYRSSGAGWNRSGTRLGEHAAESLAKGSRVMVVGRLQQRTWTAEDGSARSVVEVLAEELGPSLRWATATTTRATRSQAKPVPLGRRR